MYVTIVHVYVKPECVDDFIQATRLNHEASVQEEGNLRFDVLQMADNPQKFVLYEAYTDEPSANAHKNTEHYLSWRDSVANCMAQPREGVKYQALYPVVD
ncbi:antibiotic biosynthesis monooxygenase [Kaarinaea lacus]